MTPSKLKAAREAFGLTAEELAAWIGIHDIGTIYRWERGARSIPGPVVVLVKAALESEAVREHFGLVLKA